MRPQEVAFREECSLCSFHGFFFDRHSQIGVLLQIRKDGDAYGINVSHYGYITSYSCSH